MEQKKINWYGVFPYTEILKTNEKEPYLFALLLNDKLVGIGKQDIQGGGVFQCYNLIFNSWLDLRKNLSITQKQVERVEYESHHPGGLQIAQHEVNSSRQWIKLFALIKGKKFIGKLELPPQPRQMLYRTIFHDKMYIIYENRWKQPERFSLWSGYAQSDIKTSDKLSDITEYLSNIVGRQITIVQ